MAPILATATGIMPQSLDDPKLLQLLENLRDLPLIDNYDKLKQLSDFLEPWKNDWLFEEQVDLYQWIHPLNVIDSALLWILEKHSRQMLLLPRYQYHTKETDSLDFRPEDYDACTDVRQLEQCPPEILHSCSVLLQFSTVLLRNSINKQLYASVPAVSDLLACADDALADDAVSLLAALSLPPSIHKQQAPEHQVHTTQLHQATSSNNGSNSNNRSDVHDRLMATSRAWGTRAMGLGLYVTVTADDSIHGQGGLPDAIGQVNFCYYTKSEDGGASRTDMKEIVLSLAEIVLEEHTCDVSSPESSGSSHTDDHSEDKPDHAASKRRKVDIRKTTQKKSVRPTSELFFLAVEKAGGIQSIPPDRWFSLLADIRLARSFHSQESRCHAVCRRLRALIAILHTHPSQEMMSGYFLAQPELCVEIVDLLRPMVSSANVSAASNVSGKDTLKQDAISNLVGTSTQMVPLEVRMLAVEALTALVSRRDGSTGALAGSARLSSILTELGVGKGQYLGMLPTLIRYSLASLGSAVNCPSVGVDEKNERAEKSDSMTLEAFDIGLAFVEATMAPPLPRIEQVEKALLFIDNVLTLTTAVVSTPSGTSALVDCGLVPALLTTISLDSVDVLRGLFSEDLSKTSSSDVNRISSLLRFVTAQAVQILEGAIVTHNNALTAFHDLQGVDILTSRLAREIHHTKDKTNTNLTRQKSSIDRMDIDDEPAIKDTDGDAIMEDTGAADRKELRIISSKRVLLFSVVTCLTVVFHQETAVTTSAPTGGAQLKKPELTDAVIAVLDNVRSYGGHLASLVATLLSDIMNSDPHVVHYVHQSGIAKSFLDMVVGKKNVDANGKATYEPILPSVPELIMAVPNVVSALSLTEDGAKVVSEINPFPALLRIFYHPDYAMPRSRCLLNEMTAIIGTGLDEVMRHVERLKPMVLTALAEAMNEVVKYAEDLSRREDETYLFGSPSENKHKKLEDERSCLIQYVMNFGQLLEQILHNEDHCDPFVEAGGLDALLCMCPASMPSPVQFLSYVSCLSAPSVSSLYHSTTEETVGVASKCVEFRYNPQKLMKKLIEVATGFLSDLEESEQKLVANLGGEFSLDRIPSEPLHKLFDVSRQEELSTCSLYLRRVVNVQWITTILSNAIKAACQRSSESGSGWNSADREWRKELAGREFGELVSKLSSFFRNSIYEVCRVRSQNDFEERERDRMSTPCKGLRYRLRIVCPEGAVVRDGIEIDSCANVGSMEMGDIIDSFDRCINSSGIMRYRTKRGWVSEMTRGHGREPIAEVINLWFENGEEYPFGGGGKTRIEAGLPDIRSVAVGVLARGQSSYSDLYGSLSKLVIQSIRNLPIPVAFKDEPGSHLVAIMKLLTVNIRNALNQDSIKSVVQSFLNGTKIPDSLISKGGAAMYLGSIVSHLHLCLFDDKRERRMVNFPLLVGLVASDPLSDPFVHSKTGLTPENVKNDQQSLGIFDAFRFVFKYGLADFGSRDAENDDLNIKGEPEYQRVCRSVAASIPPVIALMRKLTATPMSSSPAASIMSRMTWKDLASLLSNESLGLSFVDNPKEESFFHPESLVADLQFALSSIAKEVWVDDRLVLAPPFLAHPLVSLVSEIIGVLEDISKKKSSWTTTAPANDRMRLSDLMRRRQEESAESAQPEFEASELAISRLTEMGFSRDHAIHALESTRSNRVETAMDFALSHGPPSPGTVERLRAAREQRSARRSQEESPSNNESSQPDESGDQISSRPSNEIPGSNQVSQPESMDVDGSGVDSGANATESATSRNVLAKTYVDEWVDSASKVVCRLLSTIPCSTLSRIKRASGRLGISNLQDTGDGDGESEAFTVVMVSFLLDLCNRYGDKRSIIVASLFSALKAKISSVDTDGHCHYFVGSSDESSVAALCHASVLVTKALPKTRLLVLKEGLVKSLVVLMQTFIQDSARTNDSDKRTPLWLAPCLLLLDVMAQPIVAFSDQATQDILSKPHDDEFDQVLKEHKNQVNDLFKMSGRWFSSSLTKEPDQKDPKPTEKSDENEKDKDDMDFEKDQNQEDKEKDQNQEDKEKDQNQEDKEKDQNQEDKEKDQNQEDKEKDQNQEDKEKDQNQEDKEKDQKQEQESKVHSHFDSIPAYFPLIPLDLTQSCIELCHELLTNTREKEGKSFLLPGVVHGALLLLLRLLRTPTISSKCLEMKVAESILELPKECSFTGNTGLVTLILRRLLEDETTLQSAMETEIRGAMAKLNGQRETGDKKDVESISLSSFIEAVTPLLCRDPASFLKAMALSVAVKSKKDKPDEAEVILLSPVERSRRLDIVNEGDKSLPIRGDPKCDDNVKHKKTPNGAKAKGKSRRSSFTKKNKKDKIDSPKTSHVDSPSVHITGLLIHSIVASWTSDGVEDEENSFLWTGSLLEILADLVLAVPACASAVHNYRPHRQKDRSKRQSLASVTPHALRDCPSPPRTFVTFLLHSLLPQDRWTIKNDPLIWSRRKDSNESEEPNFVKKEKKKAYRVMKISQTAARVLIALVVRPGEGRRRVIADLVFALSGGRLGHGSTPAHSQCKVNGKDSFISSELHALLAWGELCLGIAAPRSNGKNLEGVSALSVENIKLLLEHGTVHALLYAIHRIGLYHPMASSVCGSLLLPLEVLTRSSVSNAVEALIEKETNAKKNGKDSLETPDQTMVQNLETIDGASIGSQTNEGNISAEYNEMEDDESHRDDDEDMEGVDHESDDEDMHSSEESEDDDSEDETDDDELDEDEGSVPEESGSSEAVEDEGDWDVDYNHAFGVDQAGERQENDVDDEDGTDQIEDNDDEGWTRIESTGFGGMLLGTRRGGGGFGLISNGTNAGRASGFIDAAEAMIGTLLTNGDISGETLAEIEGTLGIRITQSGGRGLRATLRGVNNGNAMSGSLGVRVFGMDSERQSDRGTRGEVIGTFPHVHQRNQPDIGYSSFGRTAQWADISAMEYVYGGPSVTGGNRNYDVISPVDPNPDLDEQLTLTQLDLQLFPGGPASAASARTQHSLHPLLCGVDLPPINSLVSDLLPHGIRSTRRGIMTTRRPGDWTSASFSPGSFLVSTSNGNIIRSARPSSGATLGSGQLVQSVSGPVGWTDDGLPVDATIEEFSSAFETALHQTARTTVLQSERGSNSETMEREGEAMALQEQQETADMNDDMPSSQEISSRNRETESTVENVQEHDSIRSDGDRVASSLEQGLRLSSGNDSSGAADQNGTVNESDVGARLEVSDELQGTSGSNNNEINQPNDGAEIGSGGHTNNEPSGESNNPSSGDTALSAEREMGTGEEDRDMDQPMEQADVNHPSGEEPGHDNEANDALICPPDVDPEVFASLPREMQQDCIDQYNATQELAAQLDGSSLDPEVLAALPEDMRREVLEQERQERRMREQQEAPADPAHAEEMDNASFIASLAPQLREEVLLTADDAFLNSLPANIVAEAQILRERASAQQRRMYDGVLGGISRENSGPGLSAPSSNAVNAEGGVTARRKQRSGKLKVEVDRSQIVYLPPSFGSPICVSDLKTLVSMLYLLSPVRPPRLLQKLFQNFCSNPVLRSVLTSAFVHLLHDNGDEACAAVESFRKEYSGSDPWRNSIDELFAGEEFPPSMLIGAAPEIPDSEAFNFSVSASLLRRKQGLGTAASLAANLPKSAGGSSRTTSLPPIVAGRIVDALSQLCKSPKLCLHSLVTPITVSNSSETVTTCFEQLLELLDKPMYSNSAGNLEQLLTLLESAVSPLSHISKHKDEEIEIPQREVDTAKAAGKEYVDVPRVAISQPRLQLLCSILKMETCRDTSFTKVNTIVRRLCRVEMNRGYVLEELASVAHALGADAIRDLRALRIRLDTAVSHHQKTLAKESDSANTDEKQTPGVVGNISSSVTLSTSTSELKLLRVLQTLQALCSDSGDEHNSKKNEGSVVVTEELVHLLRQMQFDDLWDELSACLRVVQVLEGVKTFEKEQEEQNEQDEPADNDDNSQEEAGGKAKKLRNSAAGLLTRFLSSIEAFFVANGSATRSNDGKENDSPTQNKLDDIALENLVGGQRMLEFVSNNRVLLNALIRNNPSLLDKGFRALVQVPRFRGLLDFDVKRQWFKTQVRRLRQQASRRYGSLRLHIRRKHVFEDAYHQLQPRNADEMRGRLHVTFRNEEGVDAGGLSREFFAILAKEMFNPNYALFTSTEDGCTFQPNPNSIINPDHLSYFRFVGRVVGKAVADGFLLDAHFTRSLYKHMLGLKPTHHDMEAIDPDYYRNLKTILEYKLEDIGLTDLTFSIEDHSFGRSQVIDLIPGGRAVAVTEENKEDYVRKVCLHRMTTAIQSQIKSFLSGFFELVSSDLIAVFTPRELELLISGLPDIDVHDLKKNTDYVGWKVSDKEIEWFWNILFNLSRNEKAAFLQFVTGSSKVPLAGFSELQGMRGIQKFSIHKASASKGALMSAHTCFNSLDLPVYDSQEEMREKLLYAINEGGGAFLFA